MLQDQGRAWRAVAAAGGRQRAWRPRAMLGQRRGGVARAEEDSGEALRRWPSFLATRGAVLEQELASGGRADVQF
jgi:hypothetical protein